MEFKLINLEVKGDDKGSLVPIEENKEIPFDIKRVYYIFGTQENVKRGFHAHKKLKQIAICVHGSCIFHLNDGENIDEILLDNPSQGLFIDGLIWREMHSFSSDCVLLVIASEVYDESDYIRDFDEFINIVNNKK